MRVNLGCGDRYVDGWWNVDHEGSPHPKDETVDLTGELPWAPNTITYAYAGHILEHLTKSTALSLLVRLRACMAIGGRLLVVGPDVRKAEEMIANGTFDFRWGHTLDSLKYGGDRWPGDTHQWECDAEQVMELLESAGWNYVINLHSVNNAPSFWPIADREPQWQCAVWAEI